MAKWDISPKLNVICASYFKVKKTYHACVKNKRKKEGDHIKRFRGRLRALKLSTKALMDFIEQRSSFRTSTRAA